MGKKYRRLGFIPIASTEIRLHMGLVVVSEFSVFMPNIEIFSTFSVRRHHGIIFFKRFDFLHGYFESFLVPVVVIAVIYM